MPRTPKRLAGPTQPGAAAGTVYTVPASTKTIVRMVQVSNTTASAATLTVSIGADAAATEIISAESIPANTTKPYYLYAVVEATEIIQAKQGTASALTITVFGDEYTLG